MAINNDDLESLNQQLRSLAEFMGQLVGQKSEEKELCLKNKIKYTQNRNICIFSPLSQKLVNNVCQSKKLKHSLHIMLQFQKGIDLFKKGNS